VEERGDAAGVGVLVERAQGGGDGAVAVVASEVDGDVAVSGEDACEGEVAGGDDVEAGVGLLGVSVADGEGFEGGQVGVDAGGVDRVGEAGRVEEGVGADDDEVVEGGGVPHLGALTEDVERVAFEAEGCVGGAGGGTVVVVAGDFPFGDVGGGAGEARGAGEEGDAGGAVDDGGQGEAAGGRVGAAGVVGVGADDDSGGGGGAGDVVGERGD